MSGLATYLSDATNWFKSCSLCGQSDDTSVKYDLELGSSRIKSSPKWDAFKVNLPVSVSGSISEFAFWWKNEYAEANWNDSFVMKSITWIVTPAISVFAAVLSVVEGVARACLSLIISALSTISPWETSTLDTFNNNYLDDIIPLHLVTTRVAIEHALTGIFSPNTKLTSRDMIYINSTFCRLLIPSYLDATILTLCKAVTQKKSVDPITGRTYEKGFDLEERFHYHLTHYALKEELNHLTQRINRLTTQLTNLSANVSALLRTPPVALSPADGAPRQ